MRTAANSAILYTPGSRIYYRAAGEEYRNDWIRFRSDHSFVKLFPLTNTPFPVTDPEYCHQLFKLLTWESAFFSSESEANITHLLRVLFSKLREGIQNESPGIHDHELVALHKMIYNNPQLPWNINMMAAKLHLSPSHLQALYHRQFGSSCMDNVIEGRLRRAQDLLEYSEYSIRDISEQCGYNNVEHFCRQFRQHNGCTLDNTGKMHQREATKDFSPTIPWEEGSLRRLIEISGNSVSVAALFIPIFVHI